MSLYAILLPLHNIVRWIVVITALFAVIRAVTGLQFKRPWEAMDDKAGLWFTIAMDTQVLIGIILYFFLSPLTQLFLSNPAGAMGNSGLRFFAVEHTFLMIIALVLAHIGRARSRKGKDRMAQHRTALIFYTLTIVAVLAAIPWSRPLLPF